MATDKSNNSKDWWDKSKIIAEIVAIIALIIFGYAVNSSIKGSELDLKYIQMAVGILQSEPNDATSELRAWAVAVIVKHSNIPLTNTAKNELLKNQLPTVKWDSSISWDSDTKWGN